MDTKQSDKITYSEAKIDKMFVELEARLNKLKSNEQLRYEEHMRDIALTKRNQEKEKETRELNKLKAELKAVKKECFYLELNRDLYTFIIPVVIMLVWSII